MSQDSAKPEEDNPVEKHPGLAGGDPWEDMCRRWRRGERVMVEIYCGGQSPVCDEQIVLDLIYGEFLLRQQRGEQPHLEEYYRRFPQHRRQIERQFAIHQAFSGDVSQGPSPSD